MRGKNNFFAKKTNPILEYKKEYKKSKHKRINKLEFFPLFIYSLSSIGRTF